VWVARTGGGRTRLLRSIGAVPQADPKLVAQWPGGEEEAIGYLRRAGFQLTQQFTWVLPRPEHIVSRRQRSAIRYLMEEWDFGGVE
jgi:hypothetical protein